MLTPAPSAILEARPDTQATPVSDIFHGVVVVDRHRWLEEGEHPRVQAWTQSQNRKTRAHLDALEDRAEIHARLNDWFSQVGPSYHALVARPGRLFALKFDPPNQQRLLVTLDSAATRASEQVVLDPNALAPIGQVAVDWFVPSPDGSLVAVCLSEYGSEEGDLHFFETATGRALPDRIPRVQYPTGGGSAAWSPDGRAVFYTRYPRTGERPAADLNFYQQIYRHQLATPECEDIYCAGRDFPRIAMSDLVTSRDGRWLLATVANGDGGEYAHHLLDLAAPDAPHWRQITRFEDAVKAVVLGCDSATLFLRSVRDAPRGEILRLPLHGSLALADASVIVAQGEAVIETITATHSYLYLTEMAGGPSRLRRVDLAGQAGLDLELPEGSGVTDLIALVDRPEDERVLYRQTRFTEPDAWWIYDPAACGDAGQAAKTDLANSSPVDFSDIEVIRDFALSADGTRVPINILRRKGTPLDGNNPTLLYGYGGYGHCMRPQFNFTLRLWFDRGGVYVVANIRGGGEYGQDWHLNGRLTCKQNVFDDFAACARHLVEIGYTCPARLAVEGRSNGGLLMGAFLTQHPGLARAVISHVGIYDMLRVELGNNGAFNVPEFGSVKNPEQFQALHAYSPYHNVVDGICYPAVMLLAGEKDGRVDPAHSRKMAARLQDANASPHPVLARISSSSGHGLGTALSERIDEGADVMAFLYQQLVMAPDGPR